MSSILLGMALKSVLVLSAAWMAALAARKSSAAARHLIWTAAAVGLLALPLLSVSLPTWNVRAADLGIAPEVTFVADALARADTGAVADARKGGGRSRPAPWRPDFGKMAAAIWGVGALAGIARMMFASVAMWRLRARSSAIPEDLRALRSELRIGRQVAVFETAAGSMPMTFGWLQPAIFLPADAKEWSGERRRAVLLHELAHVKRGDVATQFIARLAVSLYWWNPLAWASWREFLKMRERAADDLVLDAGTRASDYAEHLLHVARSACASRSIAAVAMAQRSQLEGRVAAILDTGVNRKSPGKAAAMVMALAAIAAVAPVAAIHAQEAQALPADVDATIRAAAGQKNFEMLDRVAAGFIAIRQYDNAQKLLEAALDVRGTVAGEQSVAYSDGLVKLGDLARLRGKGSAKSYYEKAIALGDRPGTTGALMYLGMTALPKTPENAAGYLQRAMNADPRGPDVAEAMAWIGTAWEAQGNSAEAESWMSRAASMNADASPNHALVLELFATFLKGQGRDGEAELLKARAVEIRKDHFASLTPKATDGGTPAKIGGEVQPPSVAKKTEPEYSLEARVTKMQGTVELSVVIGTDGKVGNVKLARGLGYGLDEEALEAVSKWSFNPGTRGGVAVPVVATIQVNFRLL